MAHARIRFSLSLLISLLATACGVDANLGGVDPDVANASDDALTQPSGTPIALPGRIEAENFANGGEGVAYHDTTTSNSGGQFRSTGVDIEATTDVGGGYDVGWVEAGEWLAYQTSTAQNGTLKFTARLSSNTAGTKTLHVVVDGKALPSVSFTFADGWQTWHSVALGETQVAAGQHVVKIVFDTYKMNLNYVDASLTPSCTLSNKFLSNCGALMGTALELESGETYTQALARVESKLGRKVDIVHRYHSANESFPTTEEKQWMNEGRILFLNWKPDRASWAKAASGTIDSTVIIPVAQRLKALGKPLFLTVFHEPENDIPGAGQPSDYVAMWKHVRAVFDAQGVTNVVWVWNMMGYYGHADLYTSGSLYPGDAYVDWIAYDPYASTDTATFSTTVNKANGTFPGFYTWATQTHPTKPLMLAEFGDSASASGKASYFRSIVPSLKSDRSRIRALVYFPFNWEGTHDYRYEPYSAALDAYQDYANDDYMNVRNP